MLSLLYKIFVHKSRELSRENGCGFYGFFIAKEKFVWYYGGIQFLNTLS